MPSVVRRLLLCVLLPLLAACGDHGVAPPTAQPRALLADSPQGLPPEAVETLRLIRQGGPYPYRKDGTVFQNRERRLPMRDHGYYREYTVATPGSPDRGARRIVTGGDPPEVFYYTGDHYRSFTRIEPIR